MQRDLELSQLHPAAPEKGRIVWFDLEDPTDEETKRILDETFHFHPLAIEDCLTPSSLPKVEDYEDYLFIVTHAVAFTREDKFTSTELDLFLGKDYLVTFHRTPLKPVQAVVDRVAKSNGVVARGPDRLAHTLLDAVVDNYQPVMAELGEELDELEEAVLAKTAGKDFVGEILHVRGDFSRLRSIVRPQREIVERLARGESKLIRTTMLPYFRDLRDDLVRYEDAGESYHERLMMTFDIYLNKAAFEANEGIKFLTALTAVTLPAVLVGGWYGMNFEHMPELKSPHGYAWACTITLIATVVMIVYLKRKRWF